MIINKKNLKIFEVFFLSTILILTVTAVSKTQSETFNNYIDQEETLKINSEQYLDINPQNFVNTLKEYLTSNEALELLTNPQTQNLLEKLAEMTPTIISLIKEKIDKENPSELISEISDNQNLLINYNILSENEQTEIQDTSDQITRTEKIHLEEQNICMQSSEPLKPIELKYLIVFGELKTIYESQEFNILFNQIHQDLLVKNYNQEEVNIISKIIVFNHYLTYIPYYIEDVDLSTSAEILSELSLLSLILSTSLEYMFSSFTSNEKLSEIYLEINDQIIKDETLFDINIEQTIESDTCPCCTQQEQDESILICGVLYVFHIILVVFSVILFVISYELMIFLVAIADINIFIAAELFNCSWAIQDPYIY